MLIIRNLNLISVQSWTYLFDLIRKYLLSFLSKSYKTALVRNSSLIQPGRNMSKLLNAIMTNYDKNIRPFYGGKRECMPAGTYKIDGSNFYLVITLNASIAPLWETHYAPPYLSLTGFHGSLCVLNQIRWRRNTASDCSLSLRIAHLNIAPLFLCLPLSASCWCQSGHSYLVIWWNTRGRYGELVDILTFPVKTKSMRALWLVNQLWVIVPVNPRKNRASS